MRVDMTPKEYQAYVKRMQKKSPLGKDMALAFVITGFANAVASPALDFKAEGFVTGMAAKMFVIAGPVIVYGTLASVVYGVVLWALG